MQIAVTAARLLLGAGFVFAGAGLFSASMPPEPGLAGAFDDVFFKSHWAMFLGAAQLTAGVLMLVNRFVPVALIILAAFLYNSFGFHITMARGTIWEPVIVFVLWLVVALKFRPAFAPIFAARP